jgi:hypothetical protein
MPMAASTSKPDTVQDVYTFFHEAGTFLFDIVQFRFFFVIGIVLIMQYHLRTTFAKTPWMKDMEKEYRLGRPTRIYRRIGLNLCILQLYYDAAMPSIVKHRKFDLTICFILFETLLLPWLLGLVCSGNCETQVDGRCERLLGDVTEEEEDGNDPRWDDDDNPDVLPEQDASSHCVYTDLAKPFPRVWPCFAIQVCLVLFYISELNKPDSKAKIASKVDFGYYCVGILIQLFVSDMMVGPRYNAAYWNKLLHDKKTKGLRGMCPEYGKVFEHRLRKLWRRAMHSYMDCSEHGKVLSYEMEWTIRSHMDCFVNSITRDILLYTFPLMLCTEGPLDFVKDCTAIFFLTNLDDTGPEKSRTLNQMLARLKFNIFYESKKDGLEVSQYPKGVPLRFTYEEAAAAEEDDSSWDQFAAQRDWTFKRHHDGKLEHEHGLTYLMENLEFKMWTRKGVHEIGKFISAELTDGDDDDDPIEKLGKFIRERSKGQNGDEPMTLKKLANFISEGLKDREGGDPIEVDSDLTVEELRVLKTKLKQLSKPEVKSDVEERKVTRRKLRRLIEHLEKSGKPVAEGNFDLDDIVEAMLACHFVRESTFDELCDSTDSESEGDDESSESSCVEDLEKGRLSQVAAMK